MRRCPRLRSSTSNHANPSTRYGPRSLLRRTFRLPLGTLVLLAGFSISGATRHGGKGSVVIERKVFFCAIHEPREGVRPRATGSRPGSDQVRDRVPRDEVFA